MIACLSKVAAYHWYGQNHKNKTNQYFQINFFGWNKKKPADFSGLLLPFREKGMPQSDLCNKYLCVLI